MKERRKFRRLRKWAGLGMLLGLVSISSSSAAPPGKKPAPATDCPPQYAVCLTPAEYAEVTGTIIDLRTALRTARLDLTQFKLKEKTKGRFFRWSAGPYVGVSVSGTNGVYGGSGAIGAAIMWDWFRSK